MEERLVVHPKREILDVPQPFPVGVEDVGVVLADVPHPLWDRDVDDVADVAAALVARHDGLQLEPGLLHQLEHLLVGAPVVDPRLLPLHQTSIMTPSTPAFVSFFSCALVWSSFSNVLSTVMTSSCMSGSQELGKKRKVNHSASSFLFQNGTIRLGRSLRLFVIQYTGSGMLIMLQLHMILKQLTGSMT